MKARKLREQTDEELRQLHDDTLRELIEIRVRKGMGDASEHPVRMRLLRRDIARIKTVLRERESVSHG